MGLGEAGLGIFIVCTFLNSVDLRRLIYSNRRWHRDDGKIEGQARTTRRCLLGKEERPPSPRPKVEFRRKALRARLDVIRL